MTRPIAILLALLGVVLIILGAHHAKAAQTAVVVNTCGTPPVSFAAGQQQPILQNTAGNLCTAGGGSGGTVTIGPGSSIIGKISQVDSLGADATDTTIHAVNVSCINGCPAAITNYEQETGGNADLQTSYLLALKNAIGLPIPAQSTDGVNIGGIEGLAARGTTSTGNPVLTGCRAATASPVAVTNGQAIEAMCSETGKVVTLPYSISANFVSGVISTAMTATTSTQLLAAPAAGLRNYVTHIDCGNSAASQGTFILVQDGNAGTTIYEFPAAAAFGGASLTLPTPLRQPTTATALFVQNVTSGASVTCSASGYVAP